MIIDELRTNGEAREKCNVEGLDAVGCQKQHTAMVFKDP